MLPKLFSPVKVDYCTGIWVILRGVSTRDYSRASEGLSLYHAFFHQSGSMKPQQLWAKMLRLRSWCYFLDAYSTYVVCDRSVGSTPKRQYHGHVVACGMTSDYWNADEDMNNASHRLMSYTACSQKTQPKARNFLWPWGPIDKTSYEGRKAFLGYDSLARS